MPHAEVMHDEDHDLMKLIRKAGRLHEEGRDSDAQAVYLDVWKQADKPEDDYHACMAAHMLGVMETSLDEKLRWHVESLERANRVQDRRRTAGFYPSLYGNLGYVHRQLGNRDEALRYYRLASEHLGVLKDDAYGRSVREGTIQALTELLAGPGET